MKRINFVIIFLCSFFTFNLILHCAPKYTGADDSNCNTFYPLNKVCPGGFVVSRIGNTQEVCLNGDCRYKKYASTNQRIALNKYGLYTFSYPVSRYNYNCNKGNMSYDKLVICIDLTVNGGWDCLSKCQKYDNDWGLGLAYIYTNPDYDRYAKELAANFWNHYNGNARYNGEYDSLYKALKSYATGGTDKFFDGYIRGWGKDGYGNRSEFKYNYLDKYGKWYDTEDNKVKTNYSTKGKELFEKTKVTIANKKSSLNYSLNLETTSIKLTDYKFKIKIKTNIPSDKLKDINVKPSEGKLTSISQWTSSTCKTQTNGYSCYEREYEISAINLDNKKYTVQLSYKYNDNKLSGYSKVCWWDELNRQRYLTDAQLNTQGEEKNLVVQLTLENNICQECENVDPVKKATIKSCEDPEGIYKDPSLCSLVPKCDRESIKENIIKNYRYYNEKGCQIYCSDEVEFKFYKDIVRENGNSYTVAGRVFQYDITGNKNMGTPLYSVVANVTRSCVSKITDKAQAQQNTNVCYNLALSSIEKMGCTTDDADLSISYEGYNITLAAQEEVQQSSKLSYTTGKYDSVCGSTCGSDNNFNNMTSGTSTNATFVKREIKKIYSYYIPNNYWNEIYTGDVVLESQKNSNNFYIQLPKYSYPTLNTMQSGDMKVNLKFKNGFCYGANKNADEFELGKTNYNCEVEVKNETLKFECPENSSLCFIDDETANEELSFFYRTIELTKVFPNSRKDGSTIVMGENWGDAIDSNLINLDTFQSEYSNTSVWQKTPEYTVVIEPGGVSEIRKYNDSVNGDYTNNTIYKCDVKNGKVGYCESSFIDKIEKTTDKNMDSVTISKSGTYKSHIGGAN